MGWEYVRDTAKLVKDMGMVNVLVTNGTASREVLEEILPYVDAMNIDLKAFTGETYLILIHYILSNSPQTHKTDDMPRKNGIDTAKKIRTTDRRVKIIYVTAYQDYMSRSFSVHPFSFLLKPVQAKEIVRQVREALLYGGGPTP